MKYFVSVNGTDHEVELSERQGELVVLYDGEPIEVRYEEVDRLGQVALFVLGYYGVVRYVIEDPFRYDATPELLGPISLAQTTGVVLAALVIAAHVSRLGKVAEDPSGMVQWLGGPWTPGLEPAKTGKKKSGKKKSSKAGAAKSGDR